MILAALVAAWVAAWVAIAEPVGAVAEEINVSAAVSLTGPLAELASLYEARSGDQLVLNLGGSNALARQILAGAPADLFFSADEAQMDVLQGASLVRAEARVKALGNSLVVVVPQASAASVSSPPDLLVFRRLALADPAAVPAGVYARRWLEAEGLWQRLAPRVVPTLNVRAALALVETEAADAGIVYRTDAALTRRVRTAFAVPTGRAPAITYVLAPLTTSRQAHTSAALRFLVSREAAAVYTRYGFAVLFDH